jgi:HK97 gp10 family phage protein
MARIIDHSQEIINATNEAIYNALEIIGAKAADYAAGKAPVDTGRLKNSLTHEVAMDEKAVYVGTNVEYAPFVEYGTSRQRAQPYLRPAVENHMDEYKHILEEELKM